MKVALLSDCYLPRLGGIEVQVHDLAGWLRRAGHEVEVFTATPGRSGERHGAVELVDGVPVHHLALRLPGDLPVNPWAPPELRRRLLAGGFDVAHVHMGVVSPFASDAADVALAAGIPTAITWHCVLDVMEQVLRVSGRVGRWAEQGAALSAVSRMAARPLQRLAPRARVAVLPNGIDVDRWRPSVDVVVAQQVSAQEFPAQPVPDVQGLATLVTAMRLARRKRPVPLLRVLRRVEDQVGPEIDWRLDVFGDGPQRRLMQTYLRDARLTHRVRLRGRVTRDELLESYRGAVGYVSPVRLEAFGIAALEARAAGLPVVGMRGSGVEEFVEHGVSGLLAAGDRELGAHLVTLVSDPAEQQRIRAHNVATPPAQSWTQVVRLAETELRRAQAIRAGTTRAGTTREGTNAG
ncbi:glycosyltransferase family 4 protein [Arsenicicoccus sp. oral taxon 190]|uniref:glycosyltransferase family 4 protein n=1 Tax=Arsenicicoccus sp. oral taxon 190 TaxID=1658671 RepID=UPI00067A0FC5|nr:glycosyltransferase family 4 protein [Arsenicicoccus sp. oral taxon 190]AKT50133.1 hypothetical protein ADJ73_00140 [Arsenicicoccus sp. oral taxon 190]